MNLIHKTKTHRLRRISLAQDDPLKPPKHRDGAKFDAFAQ